MEKSYRGFFKRMGFDKEYYTFVKKVMLLAVPIALQRVVGIFVNLTDNIMVGSLGDTFVSACAISNQFFLLFVCVSSGLLGGALIISAQAWGKGNKDIIKRLVSTSIYLSIVVAILFFILTQVYAEKIISIYSNDIALIQPGSAYLRIISYSYLSFAVTTAITMMLRTVGCVKIGFYVECVNSICNVILNFILIFGRLGAPALGLNGAAIATVISRVIGLIIVLIYALVYDKKLGYRAYDLFLLPDKQTMLTYMRCGLPVLVGDTLIMLNSTVQTMITGRISSTYITANSIVHVVWQIAALAAMGFEMAAGIIIGNDIGSNDMEGAKKDGNRFFLLSILCGIAAAVIVLITGPVLLQFYKVSEAAVTMAHSMIKSASIVVFVMVIQMIVTKGVIKSGGKTRQLMIVDIISSFGFGLPLGYIAAFVLNWPPYLVYVVIRSDYLVKALWGIICLKRGDWAVSLIK